MTKVLSSVRMSKRFGAVLTDSFSFSCSMKRAKIASREIEAWVIDAARDRILWSGKGTYQNGSESCEMLDVPEPAVEKGVLIVRYARGTVGAPTPAPCAQDCRPAPLRQVELARIPLE